MARPYTVMGSAEGAAMAIQLDAMIAVLAPTAKEAERAQDKAVLRLISHLYDAAREARGIEGRTPVAAPERRGVRLGKI